MNIDDDYDYSSTMHYIEPFQSSFGDTPFITLIVSNYGSLWKFKDCVLSWTFGISRFKKFVYLTHWEHGSPTFLTWNSNEKVAFIEQHHQDYVVIAVEAVHDNGQALNHNHSIVVKVGDQGAQFDMDALMQFLPWTSMSALQEPFNCLYQVWSNDSVALVFLKLG